LELTEEQKAQMRALAEDLPKLWKSATTSAQDRKRMLRLLVEDITVEKRRAERKILLHIRCRYPEALVNRVRSLAATMTDAQITATLDQEGLLSAKGRRFTLTIVKQLRSKYRIPGPCLNSASELTVGEVAKHFGVGPGVVHYWIERGILPTRKLGSGWPHWITLSPEKEAELRKWVMRSTRIKPAKIQSLSTQGAL
jgi:hypothetical protein